MKTLLTVLCCATLASACSKAPTAAKAETVAQVVDPLVVGEKLCRRDIAKHVQFRDPESVRINSIAAGNLMKAGQHYTMSVSAKNGFGGYANPTECSCVADVPNDRLEYMFCPGGT